MRAYKKKVGTRIKITPEEKQHNIEEGTGFGNFMAKTFEVHNATRKLINTGKAIGRAVMPTLGSLAGDAIGAVTGQPELGALGGVAGQNVANTYFTKWKWIIHNFT